MQLMTLRELLVKVEAQGLVDMELAGHTYTRSSGDEIEHRAGS